MFLYNTVVSNNTKELILFNIQNVHVDHIYSWFNQYPMITSYLIYIP